MKRGELQIPQAASNDKQAIELLRVWAAGSKQHVAIRAEIWEDPAAWGIMLVDLARHVANAYEQSTGAGFEEVLCRIREGFDIEWENPTDTPSGEVFSDD